jgi:hypothetical protein
VADTKISALPTVTAVASGDKIPFTSTPGGTPVSKQITVDNLLATMTGAGLLSVTTVALNANADTTIYTVPASKRCVLSHAVLVVGADASTSEISIGQDTAETDFVGVTHLDDLDAQYDACILQPLPVLDHVNCIKSYAAATVIQAKVTNQAGGATNSLYLFGFLY